MRIALRASTVAAATAIAAVGFAGPASAHVKVTGTDADQGGYGVLTFRVPSESDTASTTELRVTLPDDTPILSAAVQPKSGWTAEVTRKKLASPQKDDDGNEVTEYVSVVDWKSTDPAAAIPPGEFDLFNLSVGPLPDTATLTLPAEQFYSDGSTVDWNETAASGQAEPEHPAPILTLGTGGSGAAAETAAAAPQAPMASATAARDSTWPGVVGLVIAIVALLLGVANLAFARRKS